MAAKFHKYIENYLIKNDCHTKIVRLFLQYSVKIMFC